MVQLDGDKQEPDLDLVLGSRHVYQKVYIYTIWLDPPQVANLQSDHLMDILIHYPLSMYIRWCVHYESVGTVQRVRSVISPLSPAQHHCRHSADWTHITA